MYTICMYVGEAITVEAGYFGAGLGMVWLEQLQCVGNESQLVDCSRGNSNPYSNCRHTDDVSVICPGVLILVPYVHIHNMYVYIHWHACMSVIKFESGTVA